MAINLPTQVTLGRLALAVLFIALLSWFNPMRLEEQRWLLQVCFWLFLVAAVSDVLDGLLARMMRSVTSLGRMLDPVVDKVMICGAFVLFASHHFWDGSRNLTDVRPWMVVVILTRELIVSVARSHSEGAGRAFGASWAGKLKMFVQSATVCVILGQLAWNVAGAEPIRTACVWLTVVVTALSALTYVRELRALVAAEEATGNQEDVTVVDSGATLGGSSGGPTS